MNKGAQRIKTKMDFQIPHLAKPLRILQLIVLLALFSFIVYKTNLIFRNEKSIPTLTIIFSILLLVLTTVFVFVLAVNIINQFDKSSTSESPMAGFSFVGFLLFSITSITIIFFMIQNDSSWVVILILCLCIISTILFLIDLILCFGLWREMNLKRNKCYPSMAEEHEYLDTDTYYLSKNSRIRKEPKFDISPSVNTNQADECEDSKDDHFYRKIARRRECVDFKEKNPSLAAGECVQVQTEPRKIFVAESQTHKLEVKETPVQTLYQPENYLPTCVIPTTNSICPAVLQLMRGEMASQYMTICKCEQGPVMHEQQHLQLQLLQSSNKEIIPSESCVDKKQGEDKATCPCPTFEIDLSSQTLNTSKTISKFKSSSCSVKNIKTQTVFNDDKEQELKSQDYESVILKDEIEIKTSQESKRAEIYRIEQKNSVDRGKNSTHSRLNDLNDKKASMNKIENLNNNKTISEEIKIISSNELKNSNDSSSKKSVDVEVNAPRKDLEIFQKNSLQSNKKFSVTEKIIQMSQEAINKAEETLSAPGIYNDQNKNSEDSVFASASYSKLSSSNPNSNIFHRKNKIDPIDFTKFNNFSNPSISKETVLKLRLPLENSTTENKILGAAQPNDCNKKKESEKPIFVKQNVKQCFKSEEICSCILKKRKQDLCTIQVQYIFQNRIGKIVCEKCATPESLRIPQKLACSAKKCIECFECRKLLSPPCQCFASDKK